METVDNKNFKNPSALEPQGIPQVRHKKKEKTIPEAINQFTHERNTIMAKTTYRKGTTDIGTFMFPHFFVTEQFDGQDTGKFTVSFLPTPEDKENLLAAIDEEWQKFAQSEEGKKHKYKYDYSNGVTSYKGEEYFKFRMQRVVKTIYGVWERSVPIFDAAGKEISADIKSVGSGTRGRIAYELMPFYKNDKNYGVSLRLTGVQIVELKEASSVSAASLGFAACEGYTYEAPTPFDDTPAAEEDF